jgi:hypothetical protein
MASFSTVVVSSRNSSLERASKETGILMTMKTDDRGLLTRFTLDELPEDSSRWMAQINLFNSIADRHYHDELMQEVVARMLS